jgi:hypothetical protein
MTHTKILFVVLLLCLLSCRQSITPNATIQQKPKPVNNDNFLVGKWMNCQELFLQGERRPMAMTRNACTIIGFEKNHSGFVQTEGGKLLFSFSWTIENGKLIITHPHAKNKVFLDGGTYKLEYKNNKLTSEVALFDTIKNIKHILERQN